MYYSRYNSLDSISAAAWILAISWESLARNGQMPPVMAGGSNLTPDMSGCVVLKWMIQNLLPRSQDPRAVR